MKTHTAVKIASGHYRIGNLEVFKRLPRSRGQTTTWRGRGTGVLGYTLKEVVVLANSPASRVFDLVNAQPPTNNTMKTTYTLKDTFNGTTISTHRTVKAAVQARRKHLAAIRRANGPSSYLTYAIISSDGSDTSDLQMAAMQELDQERWSR
jgi:hypothetical protein